MIAFKYAFDCRLIDWLDCKRKIKMTKNTEWIDWKLIWDFSNCFDNADSGKRNRLQTISITKLISSKKFRKKTAQNKNKAFKMNAYQIPLTAGTSPSPFNYFPPNSHSYGVISSSYGSNFNQILFNQFRYLSFLNLFWH